MPLIPIESFISAGSRFISPRMLAIDALTERIAAHANLVRADGCPQQQRYKPRQRSSQYRYHEIGCLGSGDRTS
jgi:hypothetical protein